MSQRVVIDILAMARKMAGHFAHSVVAGEKLVKLQKQHDPPEHKMIQDVCTRWNSTYYMLDRLYEQRQAITSYGVENDIPILSSGQYGIIANILCVLKPFEELTKVF